MRGFKLKSKTSFEELRKGVEIAESDLCLQDDLGILQYEWVSNDNDIKKLKVNPGIYTFTETQAGLVNVPFELKTVNLLDNLTNTALIKREADQFFANLSVYEELGVDKRRGVLLYSAPGYGKTVAITKICQDLLAEDPGTVIINWDTGSVRSEGVLKFFTIAAEFTEKCTRLVLIVEDIGGSRYEEGPRSIDTSLLNLLDGNGQCFKLPTLILATTNYPESLLGALADRPGRFDKLLELPAPSKEDQVELFKFYAKNAFTEAEIQAVTNLNGIKGFGPAHIKEVIVRARLTKKTLVESANELVKHKEKYNKAFTNRSNVGIFE
jgi:ATP-dependent 26S proteasome regulatory subunit